jgi:hypothetical protein
MKRPSRGERESAATILYIGCFFFPIRRNRNRTAKDPPVMFFIY